MSSSLQSGQQIKSVQKSKAVRNKHWLDTLPKVLTCPECGEKAMRRVSGSCRLLDETFIPELERFQCAACKAEFFDDAAMQTIKEYR